VAPVSALAETGVGAALRRLQGAASLQALFRGATVALCESAGFERAAIFSLRGRSLVLESAHPSAELAPEPFQLGPWLHESEVLRQRRPLLVEDASSDPRALGLLAGSRSFVAAPIVCQGRALGLIHADCGLSGEPVTEFDRDTLWAFAEGFGYAVERSVLADRLRAQSERVVALVRSAEASVGDLSTAEIQLGAGSLGRPARAAHPPRDERLDADLTRREVEVLGMLAEGETNARIAQRLVVSQDTVKTHVKHILRKLGVHNRSQAVSRFFRAQGPSEYAPFKEERSPIRSMRV
jgi:LuxR family transcriptional regulator, regulator of acetate metabolism